jgi:NADPH2:quinone reductase
MAENMQAVLCRQHAPIGQLQVADIQAPSMRPDGVRIGVRYASVNGPDLLMPLGQYQVSPPLPFVPGIEAMGVVLECGPEAQGLALGQRVMSYAGQGAFAEEMVAPRAEVFAAPDALDDVAAAGFTLVYGTAWHGLVDCAKLKAGESLVVTGAAGGIGIAAIQIAKALGARVIALASSEAKLAACREEGADVALLATRADLRDAIRGATAPAGAQVVLDVVAAQGDAVLVGHSTGGVIALAAVLAGARPRGLVLIDTGANMHGHGDVEAIITRTLTDWGPAFWRAHIERCVALPLLPPVFEELAAYPARIDPALVSEVLRSQRALDLAPRLPEIDVPCLVIHGLRDAARSLADANLLVAGLPDARLVTLDGGHPPPGELPAATAQAIEDFRAGL